MDSSGYIINYANAESAPITYNQITNNGYPLNYDRASNVNNINTTMMGLNSMPIKEANVSNLFNNATLTIPQYTSTASNNVINNFCVSETPSQAPTHPPPLTNSHMYSVTENLSTNNFLSNDYVYETMASLNNLTTPNTLSKKNVYTTINTPAISSINAITNESEVCTNLVTNISEIPNENLNNFTYNQLLDSSSIKDDPHRSNAVNNELITNNNTVTNPFFPLNDVESAHGPDKKWRKKKKKHKSTKHEGDNEGDKTNNGRVSSKKRPKRDETTYPYKCKDCRKRFRYPNSLHKHEAIHVQVTAYKCTQCNNVYDTHAQLEAHVRAHEKTYKCCYCIRVFKTEFNLQKHMLSHTDEDAPFKCSQCERIFNNKNDPSLILAHIEMHTASERAFKCSYCGRSFNNRSNMRKHQRLHKDERPYKCNICGQGFKQQCNLKPHMYIHTGERPYQCTQCSKRFIQRHQLKMHLINHENSRPYKCKICQWGFNQKGHLREHTLKCLKKPFKCDGCRLSFKLESGYTKHMEKFHSAEKYQCDACHATFNNATGLARHKTKMHEDFTLKRKRKSEKTDKSNALLESKDTHMRDSADSSKSTRKKRQKKVKKSIKRKKGHDHMVSSDLVKVEIFDDSIAHRKQKRQATLASRSYNLSDNDDDNDVLVKKRRRICGVSSSKNPATKSESNESFTEVNGEPSSPSYDVDAHACQDIKIELLSDSLSDLNVSDYVDSEVDEEAQSRQIKFEDESDPSSDTNDSE